MDLKFLVILVHSHYMKFMFTWCNKGTVSSTFQKIAFPIMKDNCIIKSFADSTKSFAAGKSLKKYCMCKNFIVVMSVKLNIAKKLAGLEK